MNYHYVWLVWSSAFLLPWLALHVTNPTFRPVLWRVSLATSLFGLTEPIWVPAYWNLPEPLRAAQRSGFDIESFIYSFGIGGIGAVLYNALAHRRFGPVNVAERPGPLHRFHMAALWVPYVLLVALYFLPWNPIYPAFLCMTIGGIASGICRPDLSAKGLVGGYSVPCPLLDVHAGTGVADARLHLASVESACVERRTDRRNSAL